MMALISPVEAESWRRQSRSPTAQQAHPLKPERIKNLDVSALENWL